MKICTWDGVHDGDRYGKGILLFPAQQIAPPRAHALNILHARTPLTADHIGLNKIIIKTGTTMAGRKMATYTAKVNQISTELCAPTAKMNPTVPTTFVIKIRMLMQRSIIENLRKALLIGLKSVTVLRLI